MEHPYTAEDFAILLERYIENDYSEQDLHTLAELIAQPAYQGLALEMMDGVMARLQSKGIATDPEIKARLRAKLPQVFNEPKPVVPLYRRLRWVAAAAVLLFAITSVWFLFRKESAPTVTATIDVKAPVKNRAAITLGDGKTIYLDSLAAGSSMEVDGVTLRKLGDGKIVYSGEAAAVAYNTASNPRGSTVMDLELSDHTHVWLNSGSSISYPVVFNGNERKVKIDGEAYFEVAHNARQPFIVGKGNTEVQVLGTHFNVKAYDNEPAQQITLLEGKVRVSAGGQQQLLAPNEQAVVAKDQINLARDVNTEDVIAWKNGFTSFHGVDMKEILRELERWYDIKTEMKKEVPANRVIDVPRTVSLQDMLKALLDDNGIAYEYDSANRKLTIFGSNSPSP